MPDSARSAGRPGPDALEEVPRSRLRRTLRRRSSSLRVKVLLMALIVVFVPLIVVWSIGGYELLVRRKISQELEQTAQRLAEESTRRSFSIATITEHRRWLRRFADRHHVMIQAIEPQGERLRHTRIKRADRWPEIRDSRRRPGFLFGPLPHGDLRDHEAALPVAAREEVLQALAGEQAATWRHTEDHRMWVFYHAVPITRGGGALYTIRISWRNVRALYDFRYALLRLTLALAAGVVLIALWVGFRLVRPISQMQQAIRDHLEDPVEVSPDAILLQREDEIGLLSRDVQSLAQSMLTQNRRAVGLAAELAHDLKNPIATVTASAELIQAQSEGAGDRLARLAAALTGAGEHMNRSVDGLLQLAQLDHELATRRRTEVDLSRQVGDLIAAYRDDPRTASIELCEAIAPGVRIEGIEAQLETLLRNLLDNAILFSRGRVKVTLGHDVPGEARLVVEDDGPGIDPGDRDKLFRRFFTARPEAMPPGSGLGLHFVRTIADAHQGAVAVDLHGDLGGARLVVTLPSVVAD